jgi:UPF0755 protein
MKQIISAKYKYFVRYVGILIVILLLPVLYHFIPLNQGTTTFYLPSSDIDDITHTLERNGYTVTFIDRWMLYFTHTPKEGWYNVDLQEYGRASFFKYLYKKQAPTMNITIYGGETAKELVHRLAKDMKLNEEKLYRLYQGYSRFQEADIIAKRYTIARKADENSTISYLFDRSSSLFKTFGIKYFHKDANDTKLKTLLIVASIIQKESNSIKEMPLIASVIYNRLDKQMKLQMDSTLNYGKYSHVAITPERIRTDTSHYNTYKHKGLPPYPLGTVTKDALHAANHPRKSDYLFFMLNEKGEHDFASTYEEHLENIKKFRAYQKKKKELNESNQTEEKSLSFKKI